MSEAFNVVSLPASEATTFYTQMGGTLPHPTKSRVRDAYTQVGPDPTVLAAQFDDWYTSHMEDRWTPFGISVVFSVGLALGIWGAVLTLTLTS